MKTKFHFFLFILLAVVSMQSSAQVKLIHYWDFNTTVVGDSLGNATNPLPPSYTTLATANPKIVYTRPYSPMMYFDSIVDNGSGGAFYYDFSGAPYFTFSDSALTNEYLKLRNPNANAWLLFYIPTTKYKNITFNYALSASSSKAPNTVFSYSTDGGLIWLPLTSAMDTFNTSGRMHPDTLQDVDSVTILSAWRPVSINFTSDANANNNAGFMVRMISAGGNDTLHSGNIRLDNFAIMGDTDITTGINESPAISAGYNIYPNPAKNNVTLTSSNTVRKLITLYNVVGQTVSVNETQNKLSTIHTSDLTAGIYFIEIKELSSGNKYTIKLVKE